MATKLKIAVYHNLHSGGAKRTLCETSSRLSQQHHLDLYDLSCSDRKFCDLSLAVQNTYTYPFIVTPQITRPFGRLNYLIRWLDLYRLESLQKKIAADIDRHGYDLVYVQPCQFTQTPGIIRHLRTPSLYYCQEPLRAAYEPEIHRPYKTRHRMGEILDRLDLVQAEFRRKRTHIDRDNIRAATMIVTNSYFTRETIYRIYGVESHVVYNGIDAEKNRPLGLTRDIGVISVGSLTPLKGFDFVVRSVALIPESVRPELTIASNYQEAAEKEYIERLAQQLGVKVRLLNMISDESLLQLYNQAQVVVCTPILEPFGLVPLEAMACAAPVVAVAEGGLRESVQQGVTGMLVDRDPADCAEAIQQLVTKPMLARSLGEAGRETVLHNWTWEKAIEKLNLYMIKCAAMRR